VLLAESGSSHTVGLIVSSTCITGPVLATSQPVFCKAAQAALLSETESMVQPTPWQRSPSAVPCRVSCCSVMRLACLGCCCSCCCTCHAGVPAASCNTVALLVVVLAASSAVAAACSACHQHAFTTAVLASALQQQIQTGMCVLDTRCVAEAQTPSVQLQQSSDHLSRCCAQAAASCEAAACAMQVRHATVAL
jgi:hypothetical protein